MSQNQAIDDADLIDQLRHYGEPNLPLLPNATSTLKHRSKKPGGTSSSSATKPSYLNDSNREIYTKKLNHYKARAKIETNPSREYLKTKNINGNSGNRVDIKRISNIFKIENDIEEIEYDEDEDRDVIELNQTEYVHVANGATSPLSMSDYDVNTSDRFNNDDDQDGYGYAPQMLSSTRAPSIGILVY